MAETKTIVSKGEVPITCGKCSGVHSLGSKCSKCSSPTLQEVVVTVAYADDIDPITKAALDIITFLGGGNGVSKTGAYLVSHPEPEGQVLRIIDRHRTDYARNIPLSEGAKILKVRKLIQDHPQRLIEIENKGWSIARYLLDEDYQHQVYSEFKEKVRSNQKKLNRFYKVVSVVAGTIAAIVVGLFT